MSSSAVAVCPGFISTKAHGVSPHLSSGRATTAASWTPGCSNSASSTSIEEMFSPPEMMMSFERSRELDVAVGVLHAEIAGMEPTAGEGLVGRGLVLEIALHHHVAAKHHLAHRPPSAGTGVHRIRVASRRAPRARGSGRPGAP